MEGGGSSNWEGVFQTFIIPDAEQKGAGCTNCPEAGFQRKGQSRGPTTVAAGLARGRRGQRSEPGPRARGPCGTPVCSRTRPEQKGHLLALLPQDPFISPSLLPPPPDPLKRSDPCSFNSQGLFEGLAPPPSVRTPGAPSTRPFPPHPLARPRRCRPKSAEGLLGKPPTPPTGKRACCSPHRSAQGMTLPSALDPLMT